MLKNVKTGIPGTTAKRGPLIDGVDEIILKTRCNPLTRAIRLTKEIRNPAVAVKYWLEIASFFYPKATGRAATPGSPVQSIKNAEQAHRLLSALENGVKQEKKLLKEKKQEYMLASEIEESEKRDAGELGESEPEGPSGSDPAGLDNGASGL